MNNLQRSLLVIFIIGLFNLGTGMLRPNYVVADAAEFKNTHGDFFNLFFTDRSEFKFGYIYEPDHEEKDGPGEFDLNDFTLDLKLPYPTSKDSFFVAGVNYEARLYDFKNVPGAATSDSSDTLYKIALSPAYGHFFTDDLMLMGEVSLGAYSDFDDGFTNDDIQLYGNTMLVYRLNPGAQILGGLAILPDFDETSVIPLLGFRLMSDNGRLHISLTLPLEARIGYYLNEKMEVYLGGKISGGQYHVKMGSKSFDAKIRDQRVGVGFVYWASKHLNLGFETGITPGSELEFETDNAGQFTEDLETSVYLSARAGIAF